ncbi:MAG: hypothetical protein WAN35_19950 [Terracidiphilus sp.]
MSRKMWLAIVAIGTLLSVSPVMQAAPRKAHVVVLGAARKVAYSKAGDPAGALAGETELRVRALVVDGVVKEWTTGDAHDVTDRSFVVRRAIKLNDSLPSEGSAPGEGSADKTATGEKAGAASIVQTGDKPATGDKATAAAKATPSIKPKPVSAAEHWVWQRGPWLLVDRVTGHIVALKLPDYDPGVSQVSWFRDYGAYCGVTVSGKSLYAVVAQVAARKAVLAKKLSVFDPESHAEPVCGPAEWQREPLKVTFHPTGKEAASFEVVPGSAVLVEDAGDD